MNGLVFVTVVSLIVGGILWYVEESADRLAEEREIDALVRESMQREGKRRGRNPERYSVCGYAMPKLPRKERRAMWRARKSRCRSDSRNRHCNR